LLGAIVAGFWGTKLFGNRLPRAGAHWVTILGVAVSFLVSVFIYFDVMKGNVFNGRSTPWLDSGTVTMQVGFLIDSLTVMMMLGRHVRLADGAHLHRRLHGRGPGSTSGSSRTSRSSPSAC
jgi:hypothetical protein